MLIANDNEGTPWLIPVRPSLRDLAETMLAEAARMALAGHGQPANDNTTRQHVAAVREEWGLQ